MIIEDLIQNPVALVTLEDAILKLRQINFFAVLLDLGSQRIAATHTPHPVEHAALRAAWFNGYSEALRDLHSFRERYVPEGVANKTPVFDFGAIDRLVKNKDITLEEAHELRKSFAAPV